MAARKSFLLRLDPETFAALQRWADEDLRSINGQLEFLLRRALMEAGRVPKKSRRATRDRPGRRRPGPSDPGQS